MFGKIFATFYIFLFYTSFASAECMSAVDIKSAAETTGSVVVDIVPFNTKESTVFLLFEDGSGVLVTVNDGCVYRYDLIEDPAQVARLLAPLGPNL